MSALLIAWLLTDLIATYGVWHFWHSFVPLAAAPTSPPAVILVAIKGISTTTDAFMESVYRQQYPHYRIVFSVEAESDPAFRLIEKWRTTRTELIETESVIAGPAARSTQKVHNLRAALGRLRATDRLVVFADADTLLPPDWLTNLVRPIVLGEVSASTGYRWALPADGALASWIGAAADLSVTTAARSRHWNVCWGGSCAVERSALDAIDLVSAWDGVASDDVTLTRALRAGGHTINSPLRSLVPSPVAHTWPGLFAFARRQHLMLRTYAPRHWLFGGWVLCVPCAGAGLAVAGVTNGNRAAAACLLASALLLQVRSLLRRRLALAILPAPAQAAARRTIRFASVAWPLVHAVHCLAFLSSCAGRRFSWAGIRYRLGEHEIRIEHRT